MNRMISVLTALGGLVVFPLVDSAIKGTIVLLLAGSVCFLLRRDSAATRHFVLSTALGLLLVMPLLSLALPAWRILPTWMRSKEPAVATAIPEVDTLPPATMMQRDLDVPPLSRERVSHEMPETAQRPSVSIPGMRPAEIDYRPATAPRSPISWTTLLSCAWLAGCLLLMGRLVVASVMLRRSERRSVKVAIPGERQGVSPPIAYQMPDGRVFADGADQHPRLAPCGSLESEQAMTRRADAQPLAEVQRLQAALVQAKTVLVVTRPMQMMLDPHRSIPVVWGLWKTRLQLPAEAIGWSDERLRSVLLHELAHVRRCDLFVLAMTQLVCALYWFNPLIWLTAWRLHVERERACDDLVLASGVRASSYAEHLLNVATRLSPSRWTQACGLAMARNSSLHRRLTAVLSEKQNRRRMTNLIKCVSLMIAGAISVPIAMLQAANSPSVEKAGTVSKKPASPSPSKEINVAVARADKREQPHRPVDPPAAIEDDTKDGNTSVKEPKHEVSKLLMEQWRRLARTDGKIPGACVGTLKTQLEEYSIAFPKLRPLTDRLDATRDWPQSEVIALLDEITDISPAGMPLQARLNEYVLSNPSKLQLGQPLPPEFNDVAWGDALANGLRAAWLVDSEKKEFSFGEAITSRLLIQNSGPAPMVFVLPKFTLPERVKVTGGELHPIPFARASGFKRVRLDPGHYVEVPGFDMTLLDSLDLTQAIAEAAVIAKPGAELRLSYSVDLTTEILQQPDDLKDPKAILLRTIANRVSEEAPLPSSAADRELLLRHVMADMFGEPPTAEETATLVADTSSEALTRLVERLQKRQPLRTFVGELTTGAATLRVSAKAIETTNVTAQEQVRKPKHDATASLIIKWQRFARTDGRIPGAVLGTVRSKIEDFLKQYPKDNATPALAELLPSYDLSHDWEPADVIALLDKTADLHTAPLGWADLPLEFGDMQRVRSGSPLPESLRNAAWGEPAENGLRVAWVLEPVDDAHSFGSVLKSRVLFHNSGESPILFLAETWRQDDRHQARDAGGKEIKVGSTWFSGITPMATFRLEPGHYIEIQGHGIGIGAGEYQEERSTGSVGAWIEAAVGEEVHFTTTVRLDQQGWTRPDDPEDPAELRKINIAERVALEAPLPASAADRKQLITRVTNEIFGEDPTDAEVNDFLNDASPDALKNLTVRLQKREHVPLFRGTLATGETIFKVLPVDPEATTRPRRAISPGRYVLSDSVHLAVQQVTSVERFGAAEVRTNNAKILFLSPDPKVASPHAPYEIRLPDGLANYAILWTRNSGQLFVVEPGSVRTIDFTNPAGVTESRSKLDLAPEYRALIPDSLQEPSE